MLTALDPWLDTGGSYKPAFVHEDDDGSRKTAVIEMYQSTSRALLALESPATSCWRKFSTSPRVRRAQMIEIDELRSTDDSEPPVRVKKKKKRLTVSELRRPATLAETRTPPWISVYLSLGKDTLVNHYREVTYDLISALQADNGEKDENGDPIAANPSHKAPESLRPYRLCFAIGGFPGHARAKQFLTAWKHPDQSKFLLAPGVEPLPIPFRSNGTALSYGQRAEASLIPKVGEAFFHDRTLSHLAHRMAVAQRLVASTPFNQLPLRLAFFSSEAVSAWDEALRGEWPGGPNDPFQPSEPSPGADRRLAAIDLQKRFPIPEGALSFLSPVQRNPALPWTGDGSEDRPVRRNPKPNSGVSNQTLRDHPKLGRVAFRVSNRRGRSLPIANVEKRSRQVGPARDLLHISPRSAQSTAQSRPALTLRGRPARTDLGKA